MENDHQHELDLNLTVLCGRLAVDAEVKNFESGAVLIRYLVTTRIESPRSRVDVIPVTLWDPDPDLIANPGRQGDRIWVCGSVQRRYWRIEVVAEQVNFKEVASL